MSKRRGRFPEPEYRLKDSGVLEEPQIYEIEIEVDNNKLDEILKAAEDKSNQYIFLDKIIKKIIKYILSGLQGTNYPISYSEQTEILNNYMQLFKKTDR